VRHVVILSHPDSASFNAAIARRYAETARSFGQAADIFDLYREDFDPRLPVEELPWRSGFQARADVVAARERVRPAEVVVFVYPLWFNAPPAMLKGFVERVFGMGFGYASDAGGTKPLLTGKNLVSISTSGAPDLWVRQTGAMDHLRTGFDDHVGAVCGLAVLDHLHLGGVTPGIRPDAAECMLGEVANLVQRHFATAATRNRS
jgi:NAD(P)H dehydrogenase (quinone)